MSFVINLQAVRKRIRRQPVAVVGVALITSSSQKKSSSRKS
jgi:hypothetical protein